MFLFCSSDSIAKREQAEEILGELAELGLMLARDLATQARAAEDTDEKISLTAAFQKTSRTVRLTLALDFKLGRDAARAEREAQIHDQEGAAAWDRAEREAARYEDLTRPAADLPPAERQKARVKAVLNRLLWNESEGDQEEYEILVEDLDARLDEAQTAPAFADLPIEVLAQKMKADLRLSGDLVVTTAERITPANTPDPPLADTG
jgi:hypothetical protein